MLVANCEMPLGFGKHDRYSSMPQPLSLIHSSAPSSRWGAELFAQRMYGDASPTLARSRKDGEAADRRRAARCWSTDNVCRVLQLATPVLADVSRGGGSEVLHECEHM